MKLLTYAKPEQLRQPKLGGLVGDYVIDIDEARSWAQGAKELPPEELPETFMEFLYGGERLWDYAYKLFGALEGVDLDKIKGVHRQPVAHHISEVYLFPPIPRPTSLRDFNAFEEHVSAAYANYNKKIPEEWYQFPVFYFGNANAIFGPEEAIPHPSYTKALDYELEVACVIGKPGINIPIERAEEHIFGYTIFNDWSARDVQRLEMRVGLSQGKGKDFANSIGPWVVTADELAKNATERPGVFDLKMVARVNNEETSSGNWNDIYYSFTEIIARASEDVWLLPGDIIGSGTVGTGCLLELTKGEGPWLHPGDVVELEVEGLGKLSNTIMQQRN